MTRKARRKQLRELHRVGAFVASAIVVAPAGPAWARPPLQPAGQVAAPDSAGRVVAFDIPAGSLGEVVPAFERASGIRLDLAADAIAMIYSPGVRGTFTVADALARILAGTSLSYRFTPPSVAAVGFRSAGATVDVTAPYQRLESPKYTAPLTEQPQTITVVPADLLDEQGATTLRDALRNVSGITFQAGEGGTPAGDQLTIRGFSARTDMFIDGGRDTGGYARDTFNLEQIEVAKGPSSAIAGRGSTGGSVNLVSKSPHLDRAFAASVEGGSAGFVRSTVDLNRPVAAFPGAAVRLNAMVTDGGVAGRDVAHNRSWGAAPAIEFGLGSPTRLTLGYFHLGQDNVPDYGLPWVPAGTIPLADLANQAAPVDRRNFYGLTARDFERVNNDLGTAAFEHDFAGGVSLRSLARAGRTRRDSVVTPPRFASTTGTDIRRTDVKSRDQVDAIVASQTTVGGRTTTGPLAHTLAAGVDVSREASTNYARAEVGPDSPASPDTDLYHPTPDDAYTGRMVRTGAYTDATAISAAAYAFDTVAIGSRWDVTGGLRFDRFEVNDASVAAGGDVSPLGRADHMVSTRGGLVFKPRPSGSLYVGLSTAFNPSAEGLALRDTTVETPPERTRSLEAGLKWTFDGGLLASAAVFRTDKTNARTPGLDPGDPPTVLDGRQTVEGVEVSASGSITRHWSGFATYAHMRSGIAASNDAEEIDNALALTPRNTLSLWTTVDAGRVHLGGGAQFMDTVFRDAANARRVPGYWLGNGTAAYDVNTHLTLRVNVNNLTDANYVDRTSGGHFIPGPARTLLVTSDVRFD